MDTSYADAINSFNDKISTACFEAEKDGLSIEDCASELKRIADEIVAEAKR